MPEDRPARGRCVQAVARTMVARQTCFCGALRSVTTASSGRRSSGVTVHNNSCSHPRA